MRKFGILSVKMVNGCTLTGGVIVLLLLLLSPALSFRLQNNTPKKSSSLSSQASSSTSSATASSLHKKYPQSESQVHTARKNASGSSSVSWPPRIPVWAFLPSSSNQHQSESSTNFNSAKAKPSKRESSRGLNLNMLETALHPNPNQHSMPEEDNDDLYDEEDWIVNLKRAGSSGQHVAGVKRTRMYDVPQIECPPAEDGMERFACPTPDKLGRYPCVDDHVLCDGFVDCPGREDEDRQACMFYKTTKAHLDVLADALLRWARGRR